MLGPGAGAAFTTRASGNLALHVGDDPAAVRARREAVAEDLGIAEPVWCEQVHGASVVVVTRADRGATIAGADALVTTHTATPLAVLAADCVPLLLAGDGVVGAAHAGRRGLVAGVVENTVDAMRRLGAGTIAAAIGPCIGPCCYEVGDDVATEVTTALPVTRATTTGGRPSLDLVAGVRDVLSRAGITRITTRGGCTAHQPEAWFSYRRDGATGRQAGIVWRP